MAQPFTIKVRRGLRWIWGKGDAHFQAIKPGELNAKERDDVRAALQWIHENCEPVSTEPKTEDAPA